MERSICKRAANIGLDIGDFVSDNIHSDNTLQEREEGVKIAKKRPRRRGHSILD